MNNHLPLQWVIGIQHMPSCIKATYVAPSRYALKNSLDEYRNLDDHEKGAHVSDEER